MNKKRRFDRLEVGLIPGIFLPVLVLLIFWQARFEGNLADFLGYFQRSGILSKLLSLAAIPNLLLFFLFIWTNRSFSARGVIFATFVLALVMLILKFA